MKTEDLLKLDGLRKLRAFDTFKSRLYEQMKYNRIKLLKNGHIIYFSFFQTKILL